MRNGRRIKDFPTWHKGITWRDYVAAYEQQNHLRPTTQPLKEST